VTRGILGLSPRTPVGGTLQYRKESAQWVYPRAREGSKYLAKWGAAQEGISPSDRGEDRQALIAEFSARGLSPLTRGGSCGDLPVGSEERFIPAHAGEPMPPPAASADQEVYLRACGGNVDLIKRGGDARGLSPRMRGELKNRNVQPDERESIPAHAGEPVGARSGHPVSLIYPRVIGGNLRRDRNAFGIFGLSRTRGGTGKQWFFAFQVRVYPRGRWENRTPSLTGEEEADLSTRPREETGLHAPFRRSSQVYPPHEGVPLLEPGPFHLRAVFPRVHGEK